MLDLVGCVVCGDVLPEAHDRPPHCFERSGIPSIPRDILGELCCPIIRVGFWVGSVDRADMPEASINEYRDSRSRKDDVDPDWPVRSRNPSIDEEPPSPQMELGTQRTLRRSIPPPVCPHPNRRRAIGGGRHLSRHTYRNISSANAYDNFIGAALPIIRAHRPRPLVAPKSIQSGRS